MFPHPLKKDFALLLAEEQFYHADTTMDKSLGIITAKRGHQK
jgi:hypothetical protein